MQITQSYIDKIGSDFKVITLKEAKKLTDKDGLNQRLILDTKGRKVKYFETDDNGNLRYIGKKAFSPDDKLRIWKPTRLNGKKGFLIVKDGSQYVQLPNNGIYYIGAGIAAGVFLAKKYI